jgi:alginate O-acetyltransferase complex protein AlgI
MLFNSPEFLFLFLPIVLIVFFAAGGRGYFTFAMSWLVLASLFFYGYWNPAYVGLIVVSILFNYSIGVWLSGHTDAKRVKKNLILAFGITVNLSLLGYFKYANFFVDSLYGLGLAQLRLEAIILPLGISFFTFNQTAYLVDAWKGEAKEYNLLHYLLFVTFFPHLIAGPIIHHKEMMPQFRSDRIYTFSLFNLAIGLSIFFVGLFKKVVIADNLAPLATPVFSAADHDVTLNAVQAWQGMVAYTFQLYFDFSGYSDMAIGLARMFGIYFPLNFNSPYQAVNIIDFWRRWHMTLSRFLRDYIYIPLGGNRKGKGRRYLNLMATMLLGGLWHGAGWTFIFWGFLHGLYLVINYVWQRWWTVKINRWWSVGSARLLTLMAVMVGWVFFRAPSFEAALNVFEGMLNIPPNLANQLGAFGGVLTTLGFSFEGPRMSYADIRVLVALFGVLLFIWFAPNTQQVFKNYRPAYDYDRSTSEPAPLGWDRLSWRPSVPWSAWVGVLAALSLLGLSQVSEFLYYDF